eukprot:Hpha_TRINITY_DN31806_c0_g1::TRINITY_DN31806_c0_g1_i1::g.30003::m.30003/K13574/ybiC; uncharacterized oxidoreductase
MPGFDALLWGAAGSALTLVVLRARECVCRRSQAAPAAPRGCRLIQHDALRAVCRRVLQAGGSDEREQQIVTDHLVGANLAGHDSHGVQMLRKYMLAAKRGLVTPNAHARLVSGEGPVIVVDGQGGFGPVVAREAMELTFPRARKHGVCVLALQNCFHIGRAGPYTDMAADGGLVAFAFVNAVGHPPVVAPYGGSEGRLNTNPFCASVPVGAGEPHLTLDFATSIVANGKLQAAANKGERVSLGLLLDEKAGPTDDPMYPTGYGIGGAILPFGLHKGAGLSLFCELLGGCLTGGDTVHPDSGRRDCPTVTNSAFIVVVSPEALCGGERLLGEVRRVRDYVGSCPPLSEDHQYRPSAGRPPPLPEERERVLLPGERELLVSRERTGAGVPVAAGTWDEVLQAGAVFGVAEDELEALVRA